MIRFSTYGLAAVALAVVLRPFPAATQEVNGPADPLESTAAAFFADLEAERWDSAAARLDSAGLAEWHAGVLEEMDWRARSLVPTVDQVMAWNPEMSREVAEHSVAEMEGGTERQLRMEYANVRSLEALRDLDPKKAAARALEARGHRYAGEMFPWLPGGQEPRPPVRSAERRRAVLGSIREGEDLGYVVYLERWVDPLAPDAMEHGTKARVATLRRTESGWALLSQNVLSRSGAEVIRIEGPPPGGDAGRGGPHASPAAPAEPPEATAIRLFAALEDDRWAEAATLFDPDGLDRWHRRSVQQVEMQMDRERPTVEEMMERQPELPRAVAEHRSTLPQPDPFDFLDPPLAGVASLEGLRALSSQEAAARALDAAEGTDRFESMMEQYGEEIPAEYLDILRPMSQHRWSREMIGVVRDPEGLAHVVYRARWGGDAPYAIDEVRVLTLVPTDEGWRVEPAGRGLLTEESLPRDWPATLIKWPL